MTVDFLLVEKCQSKSLGNGFSVPFIEIIEPVPMAFVYQLHDTHQVFALKQCVNQPGFCAESGFFVPGAIKL